MFEMYLFVKIAVLHFTVQPCWPMNIPHRKLPTFVFISFYSLTRFWFDPFVSMGFLTGVKQSENGRQLEAKFCLQAVIFLVSNCHFSYDLG